MAELTKQPPTLSTHPGRIDLILRASVYHDQNTRYLDITVIDTDDIKNRLKNLQASLALKVDVLREVVISQKKLLDYNGVYNAYLMGHLSEEEFYEEAEKFSYDPIDAPPQALAVKIACLIGETKIDYTEAELASLFTCSESSLKAAVSVLTGPDTADKKLAGDQ